MSEKALGRDIQARFTAEPDLPGIVVISDARELLGLVSRRRFMELFSKPYRMEIYSDRTVGHLLKEIDGEMLVFQGASLIDVAASAMVKRSASEFSEPVVLRLTHGEIRVVDSQTLLSALANSYATQFGELQAAKDTIVENEKLASLGSLVAGLAHEINTPLGVGITALSTMVDQVDSFQQRVASGGIRRSDLTQTLSDLREMSATALRTLEKAAELVSSFKQVSADQVSEARRHFDLGEELRHVVVSLGPTAKRAGVTLLFEPGAELQMDSFPGALSQVVTNLIINAVKHAFEGRDDGTVTIDYHQQPTEKVVINVSDNGSGITAQHLERIFEPFFTTKRGFGGTGLGLSIVHNLARSALGGNISVRSTVGQGSCFSLVIPCIVPTAAVRSK